MQDPKQPWRRTPRQEGAGLAWPDYPSVFTTLLAAGAVAGLFLGLGTLTVQGWVIWLGLVIAAGILASHVVRHRQATQRRAQARTALGARLMSQCKSLGGSSFLQRYHDGMDPVVLVLTDDALHIGHPDPLHIFATLPLYEIDDVQVGPVKDPKWDSDEMQHDLADEPNALNLAVHMSGQKIYRLAFSQFEKHAPPDMWATSLRKSVTPPVGTD